MTIDRVTMFKCPETGKLFKTERGAKNCAERERGAKELSLLATGFDPSGFEAQQDYVRLNATRPQDIMELVREKAEEFWGLKVTRLKVDPVSVSSRVSGPVISFGQCLIEVDSSESCRLAYMREQARIVNRKRYRDLTIYDLLFGSKGFKGFSYSGSGGMLGRCSDGINPGFMLDMSFTARLEEFPLINQSYHEWLTHKNEFDEYEHKKRVTGRYGRILAQSSPEYEKLRELVDYHERCVELVRVSVIDLVTYYTEGLVEKWVGINPPVVKKSELWDMFAG